MYVYMYIYIKNTIIENINIPLKKESTIFLKVHTGNIFVFMGHTIYGILQARTLGWVAAPFSWESSQPRDQTQVFRIAGGFFTS